MFPPSFVAVDHWLPVMKVLLPVERYREQHPEEEGKKTGAQKGLTTFNNVSEAESQHDLTNLIISEQLHCCFIAGDIKSHMLI